MVQEMLTVGSNAAMNVSGFNVDVLNRDVDEISFAVRYCDGDAFLNNTFFSASLSGDCNIKA